MITDKDLKHLIRCVELAEEALDAGNQPFGSILVSADGNVLIEAQNETITKGDPTRHPEFEIARWAATNMNLEERKDAVVYTSGEHCAMCSAAHGWIGLGRIVYASSTTQLTKWLKEMKIAQPPIKLLPIGDVYPTIPVDGPVPELAEKVHKLHKRFYKV